MACARVFEDFIEDLGAFEVLKIWERFGHIWDGFGHEQTIWVKFREKHAIWVWKLKDNQRFGKDLGEIGQK